MKIEIKFKETIPSFLFKEGIVKTNIYASLSKTYLGMKWISEPIINKGGSDDYYKILFDNSMEKETITTTGTEILVGGTISSTESLMYKSIYSQYNGFIEYSDSVSSLKQNFNKYLIDQKGKAIILTVNINDLHSTQLKIELEANDRRELLSEKQLYHEEDIAKEFKEWDQGYQKTNFYLTGEPFTTRSQCLYSGTVFPGFYGGNPRRSHIIPSLYSDPHGMYKGVMMATKDDELIKVSYGSPNHQEPFEAKDANTNKVLATFFTKELLFEDLATKPELQNSYNLDMTIYELSKTLEFQKDIYKETIPSYIFPWFYRLKEQGHKEPFTIGKLKSVYKENGLPLAPSRYINFLSKNETPNKWKLPLPLEINQVLPIFELKDVIDEYCIENMTLNLLEGLYNNKHRCYKASLQHLKKDAAISSNYTLRDLINMIVYGSEEAKTDKKHLFVDYRQQILARENIPPLYYKDY